MKIRSFCTLVVLALVAAACNESPTITAAASPARFDTGHTVGSGNDSEPAVIPGAETTADDGTVASDTTGRGGHTVGSGN